MKTKLLFFVITCMTLLGLSACYGVFKTSNKLKIADFHDKNDFYANDVQPVFNNKCVACHSCFNSPCQLNLTSFEGLSRGASKVDIYDFPKLEGRAPTRLYEDAHTVKDWRKKGFYNVYDKNSKKSILSYLISKPKGVESGQQKAYESEKSRICISSLAEDNIKTYAKQNPAGRMPFGFSKLTDYEINIFEKWQSGEFKESKTEDIENKIFNHSAFKKQVLEWEDFLNAKDLKAQISARYIFEHFFLANVFFENQPQMFFRMVRSETKSGDIFETSTVYPFDKPKAKFYYRLRPVIQTIVHKNHIPIDFSKDRLEKYKDLFWNSKWTQDFKKMPNYGKAGANPFTTFEMIPPNSRYRFFLKDAGYFVMTFIKGPVCRGQTALNVINDNFWVMFMDPKHDALVNSQETYSKVSKLMTFPSEIKDDFKPMVQFKKDYWSGVKEKFNFYNNKNMTIETDWIWNGDQVNTNAALTVYRHFDSAQVLRGFKGEAPKTFWVLDYQVFESIYYNLTAGYNVFGPVLHQLNSRLYMDISRIAAEDLFLTLLPKENRIKIRNEWNQEIPKKKESVFKHLIDLVSNDVQEKMSEEYKYQGMDIDSKDIESIKLKKGSDKESDLDSKFTSISKFNSNPNSKVDESKLIILSHLTKIQKRFSKVQIEGQFPDSDSKQILSFKKQIQKIKPINVSYLPDTLLIKIKSKNNEKYFTLIHNKDHFNVGLIFFENERRNPSKDSLDLIEGIATSYANIFIELSEDKFKTFLNELINSDSEAKVKNILKQYSISRTDKNFWDIYKQFSMQTTDRLTNETGWLDLNRFENF